MRTMLLIVILGSATMTMLQAQNVNWKSFNGTGGNLVYADFGYDFGVTTQVGYGRMVNAIRPVLLTIDYSMPMGDRLFDDFKTRFGGQVELLEKNGFALSGRVLGVFRRHQTSLVRILNFGGEFALIGGYYAAGYHVALELAADGAVISHLKHSRLLVENYPQIHDGWYLNNGAHYLFGIEAGKSIGSTYDVSLRLGRTNARGSSEDILPVYLQLGLSKRF